MVAAAIAHCLWLPVCDGFGRCFLDLRVDLESAIMLVAGQYGRDDAHFEQAVRSITDHPLAILTYFLLLYAAAHLVGILFSKARASRGDIGMPSFLSRARPLLRPLRRPIRQLLKYLRGFDEDEAASLRLSEWIEVLPESYEREMLVTLVGAIIESGGRSYLYTGLLERIHWDELGNPEWLILRSAMRRDLKDDDIDEQCETPFHDTRGRYYRIRGDMFMFRVQDARNLNVRYFTLDVGDVFDNESMESSEIPGFQSGVADYQGVDCLIVCGCRPESDCFIETVLAPTFNLNDDAVNTNLEPPPASSLGCVGGTDGPALPVRELVDHESCSGVELRGKHRQSKRTGNQSRQNRSGS